MSFWPKTFRRKSEGLPPWAALDQETLRISAAMEHIRDHGNLDTFPGDQSEKLALMLTASRQGLVTWNRGQQTYELTRLGRERLGVRPAAPDLSRMPQQPPIAAGPVGRWTLGSAGRWTLGSGTILAGAAGLAVGAAAMAFMAGSSSTPAPTDRTVVAAAPEASQPRNDPPPRTPATEPPAQTAQQSKPPEPAPAPARTPAPAQQQASNSPNPGIPCRADKCLNTGGSGEPPAQQASGEHAPEEAVKAEQPDARPATPPPAATATAPVAAPPAQRATASPPPASVEPPKPQQQAGLHPGAAGAVEGALMQQLALAATASPPAPPATQASTQAAGGSPPAQSETAPAARESKPAVAPKAERARRLAERAPPEEAAPSTPEPSGYARSESGPKKQEAAKTTRSRAAASEQRRAEREARRKATASHRDYADRGRDLAEPDGALRPFPEDDDGPPVFLTRRYRGDPDGWRASDRNRPGYAYREASPFGDRSERPRFGLFDWLFR